MKCNEQSAGSRGNPTPEGSLSFLSLVQRRVSVRSFRSHQDVSDHQIHAALRVARLAPSAGNLQAFQVVVVRDASQKRAIASAALNQMWIAQAPVILVFLADPDRSSRKYGQRGHELYSVQDATIAAAYCQLALEAAGLASCWVGAFHDDLVANVVVRGSSGSQKSKDNCVPTRSRLRPVVVMPVGQAAERPPRHHRRGISEFVHSERICLLPNERDTNRKKRNRREPST